VQVWPSSVCTACAVDKAEAHRSADINNFVTLNQVRAGSREHKGIVLRIAARDELQLALVSVTRWMVIVFSLLCRPTFRTLVLRGVPHGACTESIAKSAIPGQKQGQPDSDIAVVKALYFEFAPVLSRSELDQPGIGMFAKHSEFKEWRLGSLPQGSHRGSLLE
jgi:hypothetical protein